MRLSSVWSGGDACPVVIAGVKRLSIRNKDPAATNTGRLQRPHVEFLTVVLLSLNSLGVKIEQKTTAQNGKKCRTCFVTDGWDESIRRSIRQYVIIAEFTRQSQDAGPQDGQPFIHGSRRRKPC
jgi:hypothetical protein